MFQNKKIKQLQKDVMDLQNTIASLQTQIKNLDLSYHECNLKLIHLGSKPTQDKVKFTIQKDVKPTTEERKSVGRGRPKKNLVVKSDKLAVYLSIPMPIFKILKEKYNLKENVILREIFEAHVVRSGLLVMNSISTNIFEKETKVSRKGAIWINYEYYHKLYELSKISGYSMSACLRMLMFTFKEEEIPSNFIEAVKKVGIRNIKNK
jgi:hypothetical protein